MNYSLGISNPFDNLQRVTMLIGATFEEYLLLNQFLEVTLYDANVMCYHPQELVMGAYKFLCEFNKKTQMTKRLKKYFHWSDSKVKLIKEFIQY